MSAIFKEILQTIGNLFGQLGILKKIIASSEKWVETLSFQDGFTIEVTYPTR
jgi:hypothetical protein